MTNNIVDLNVSVVWIYCNNASFLWRGDLSFWLLNLWMKSYRIREIKIHVYGRRQTLDLSWEFLRIESKQIKTVLKNSYE